MLGRFKRLFKRSKEPKYKVRSRTRLRGWIVCECKNCECSKLSRWEDRQCIECWWGVHRKQLNIENEDNQH